MPWALAHDVLTLVNRHRVKHPRLAAGLVYLRRGGALNVVEVELVNATSGVIRCRRLIRASLSSV